MDANTVAVTIRDQIRFGSVRGCRNGTHAMMCWGFQTPTRMTDEDGLHSLIFKVNGLKYKGKVKVKLMGNDTYSIFLFNGNWRLEREDVYCEELAQILDTIIEGE